MKKRIKSLFLLMATIVATLMFSSIAFAATYQAPGQVTGLKQAKANDTSVEIAWDAQIGAYYSVEYSTDGANWTVVDTELSPANYHNGLSQGKSYYVRVRAYRSQYINLYPEDRVYGPYSDTLEVITRPDEVTSISQTDATYDTASFTWNQVEGVTQYEVYKTVNGIDTLVGTTNTNSITVTGLAREEFSVSVLGVKKSASGFEAKSSYKETLSSWDINLIPAKVGNVHIANYWGSLKEVNVEWDGSLFADGYQIQVYKNNAKKAMSNVKTSSKYVYIKNINNKSFYKVRVRAYTTVNGQVKYGDWSSYTWFAQQTNVDLKFVSSKKLKVSWNKVKGATSYTVYMSTSKNTNYKKVKTLKKRSYTVTKFKKKKLSIKKRYYVYVVANKKVGKNTVKSAVSQCYYLY